MKISSTNQDANVLPINQEIPLEGLSPLEEAAFSSQLLNILTLISFPIEVNPESLKLIEEEIQSDDSFREEGADSLLANQTNPQIYNNINQLPSSIPDAIPFNKSLTNYSNNESVEKLLLDKDVQLTQFESEKDEKKEVIEETTRIDNLLPQNKEMSEVLNRLVGDKNKILENKIIMREKLDEFPDDIRNETMKEQIPIVLNDEQKKVLPPVMDTKLKINFSQLNKSNPQEKEESNTSVLIPMNLDKKNPFSEKIDNIMNISMNIPDIFNDKSATIFTETSNPLSIKEDNKYINIFNNLGSIINQQTVASHLEQHSNFSDFRYPLSSNSVLDLNEAFNPSQDIKFNMSMLEKGGELYDAKIKIHPPELGHIVATLKVEKNKAELLILTENNHVKQIVESSLPVLKQYFQDANIHLKQIDIQSSSDNIHQNLSNNQNDKESKYHTNPEYGNLFESEKVTTSVSNSNKKINTLIDTYA